MLDSIAHAIIRLVTSWEYLLPHPWNWVAFIALCVVASILLLLIGLGYLSIASGTEPPDRLHNNTQDNLTHLAVSYVVLFAIWALIASEWKLGWGAHATILIASLFFGLLYRNFRGITHAAASYLVKFYEDWKENWIAFTVIFFLSAVAGWMFGIFLLLVSAIFLTPKRIRNIEPETKPAAAQPELTQPKPDYV